MKIRVEVLGMALQGQQFYLRPQGSEASWVVAALFDASQLKQRALAGSIPSWVDVDLPDALLAEKGWLPAPPAPVAPPEPVEVVEPPPVAPAPAPKPEPVEVVEPPPVAPAPAPKPEPVEVVDPPKPKVTKKPKALSVTKKTKPSVTKPKPSKPKSSKKKPARSAKKRGR